MTTATVVIPCYRYGHFLKRAVAAALDQPGIDVDVVIVDDASPDGSVRIARACALRDSRVSVIAHEENLGHIATYNDGLAAATGEYVALVSADDVLTPGALRRAAAVMEEHASVGLVYGDFLRFSDEEPTLPPPSGIVRLVAGDAWIADRLRRVDNPIASPEAVLRREAVRPYDARLPHTADLAMWLSVARSWDVAYLPGTVQALYRQHVSQMHLRYAGALGGGRRDAVERFRAIGAALGPAAAARAIAHYAGRKARVLR